MYDHITPLLRILAETPLSVLRIESRLLALASKSLCCVTVCLFRFIALFFPSSCPSSEELLMYWVNCGSADVSHFSCQCLWTGFLHTVSEVSLPVFLVFSSRLQLLQKLKIQLSHNLEGLHLILSNYLLCFSSIIVSHHCVALLSLCSFSVECSECDWESKYVLSNVYWKHACERTQYC